MRQFVSGLVALHWAGVFGLFAFVCVADPHSGATGALRLIGLTIADGGGTTLAALLGLSFAVSAALFTWMLADCLFGEAQPDAAGAGEQASSAFAAGGSTLLFFLCFGLFGEPGGKPFLLIEGLLAAFLVSYLAICAEQFLLRALGAEPAAAADPARGMALGAARDTLLSQISGRAGEAPAGRF